MAEMDYSPLFEFISYFEDDSSTICTWKSSEQNEHGVFSMPYPIYDEPMKRFIGAVSDSGLMLKDYLSHLKDKDVLNVKAIQQLNAKEEMEQLRAVLTYFVRQERFCDGMWEKAAHENIFLAVLYKLREA